MARKEALLRLQKTLLARRDALKRALEGELADLGTGVSASDVLDAAFEAGSDEVASQLAELASGELVQVDRALKRLNRGDYGLCEYCQDKIPIARLEALPFSTTCIECQRETENSPGWGQERRGGDWERVYESRKSLDDDRVIKLSEIEMDVSSSR